MNKFTCKDCVYFINNNCEQFDVPQSYINKESTKQYLNSKYGIKSAEIDNIINSQDVLDYINNDKYETFKCYQHRKHTQLLETAGTIFTIILFFMVLYLAFISLPLS